MRQAKAIITIQPGKGGLTQHVVQNIEQYTTEESIDNDADTFNIVFGDSGRGLEEVLDRDAEVRVNLFIDNALKRSVPVFTGLADVASRDLEYELTIQGRDVATSLAVDTDALPFRWRNLDPQKFIEQRAHALGIATTQIAKMSQIHSIYTDGSEKEWAFWYRIVRSKGMYMWTNHFAGGTLIVDHLGYSTTPTYFFGDPPRGQARGAWQKVESLTETANKQGRVRKVLIYGETVKKSKVASKPLVGQSLDISIPNWKKQPVTILTDTQVKDATALQKIAHTEMYETIVGAIEYELTLHDSGQLIVQNRMAQVNLPDYGLVGMFFVVGVQRQANESGFMQIVRLREKGFALSKRIPDAPTLAKTQTSVSDAFKSITSISAGLAATGNSRWPDSFVKATRLYGGSWDFAVFMGALLAICQKESGFANVRQTSSSISHVEWTPFSEFEKSPVGSNIFDPSGLPAEQLYSKTFANDPTNRDNPFAPDNAGVGPMQLTDTSIKEFADSLGFNGKAKVGELDGGRWNPDSNIVAAAKLLAEKANVSPPVNPLNPDDMKIVIGRYNGSGPAADKYANDVWKIYLAIYGPSAVSAVTAAKSLPPGTTDTSVPIPGHGTLDLPDNTPDDARKAIAWALSQLGTSYQPAGYGNPGYDCSSFVTEALVHGSAYLRGQLNGPSLDPPSHGEDTNTLYVKGTPVTKDKLLPADLVFFEGDPPGHVGLYLTDNLFIHDPHSGDVVKVSGLGEDYYTANYTGARRYVVWNIAPVNPAPVNGGWLGRIGGGFEVEQLARPLGGAVDLSQPEQGIMHTTEGSTFSGALSTLDAEQFWPNFMVGVEASGAIRICQFYPFGTAARAVEHTGAIETNAWARAQIEVVGFSNLTTAWEPSNPTFDALAALLAALSRDPWNIPLTRPGGWADTYDGTGARRVSGVWGTQAGWYGHSEIPENSHLDPGKLIYSDLFTRALSF